MRRKTAKKTAPAERNKMTERIVKLILRLQKIREAREKNYNKRINEEIVKPVKQAAEKAFKTRGLGKPKVIVIKSKAHR